MVCPAMVRTTQARDTSLELCEDLTSFSNRKLLVVGNLASNLRLRTVDISSVFFDGNVVAQLGHNLLN